MGAGLLVRAAPGTPATPTHLPGNPDPDWQTRTRTAPSSSALRVFLPLAGTTKSTTSASTTSRRRRRRATAGPPTPRRRATQRSPPLRLTPSTTPRPRELRPCEYSSRPAGGAWTSCNICVVFRYNPEQYSPYAAPSPQGSYQPSPSPQSYHQVAPSPVGFQNTHSPASYHPTPSPMAYQV